MKLLAALPGKKIMAGSAGVSSAHAYLPPLSLSHHLLLSHLWSLGS